MAGTLFDRVGGMPFFEALTGAFYEGVANDPLLRPMYPEDLGPSAEHLALFLGQYFGGPAIYEERRGEPRLRLRHMKFVIDKAAKDAWLGHMHDALAGLDVDSADAAELERYLASTAQFLVNQGLAFGGS